MLLTSVFIKNTVFIVLLLCVLLITIYQYYSLAEKLYLFEIERSGKGYVSDEVWYVNSARNILLKIFGIKPRPSSEIYSVSIVYNSTLLNNTYIRRVISENNLSISIVDEKYYKIKAIYLESPSLEELVKLLYILNETSGVLDTVWGWRIGDARDINKYFNLEHPPLYKYLICLSIHMFGDNPVNWRIPSIIAGLLTVLFTFLSSFKLIGNKLVSLVIALFTGLDPVMRTLSSIGLIDIYVALITSIVMYLVFMKKYRLALITSITGSLFKLTSLFLILPVLLLIIRDKLKKNPSVITLLITIFTYSLISLALFLVLQIIVSIPLIKYFGFNHWFYLSFINALKWHISTKCIGQGCPISSAPWDWFIGNNAFTIYYFTIDSSLVASGFWPLWLISLVYTLLFLPIYRYDKKMSYIQLFFITILLNYILLYIIGSRTQYSFYSVHFTPIIYLNLVYAFTYIVFDFNKLRTILIYWKKLFNKTWFILLWILRIEA